jgi:Bacterial toxin 50
MQKVRIHWDRQNKHIIGSHNFVEGGGRIEIEPSQLESLLKKHAGQGEKVTGVFLEAGYRERVDFGVIIAICKTS